MSDIDQIIRESKAHSPGLQVEQLKVAHPGADDDGLWFFTMPGSFVEIQLESIKGMCPFIIESNQTSIRHVAQTSAQAIQLITSLFHKPQQSA